MNLNSFIKVAIALFFLVAVHSQLIAQAPQAFSYQSVIRDGAGELVANQEVGIQISILQGSASGIAVYTETHSPTTNANGLASIAIGTGSVVNGVFADIDWANGPYFVQVQTDPSGGTNFSIVGVSELLSAPYALLAQKVVEAEVPNPPLTVVFTDQVDRTISANWTIGPTFPLVSGFRPGSKVKIEYAIPSRSLSNGWSGLYIEPQVSFDNGSSWNSLGSSGYDGNIMVNGPLIVGTYANFLLIDPDLNEEFSITLRFYFRSYQQIARVNGAHDINSISGTASLMSGVNGTQHFTKVIITEIL